MQKHRRAKTQAKAGPSTREPESHVHSSPKTTRPDTSERIAADFASGVCTYDEAIERVIALTLGGDNVRVTEAQRSELKVLLRGPFLPVLRELAQQSAQSGKKPR
jgi:hypothetical protein